MRCKLLPSNGGTVLCAQATVFYALLFAVPSVLTFAYTGGRTQLSREELLNSEAAKAKLREMGPEDVDRMNERKAMMNKVLFETRGSLGKPDWAIKRDQERLKQQQQQEER